MHQCYLLRKKGERRGGYIQITGYEDLEYRYVTPNSATRFSILPESSLMTSFLEKHPECEIVVADTGIVAIHKPEVY